LLAASITTTAPPNAQPHLVRWMASQSRVRSTATNTSIRKVPSAAPRLSASQPCLVTRH